MTPLHLPVFSSKCKILIVAVIIGILVISITAYALWQGSVTIPNIGIVKTYGLTVTDAGGSPITQILWGQVELGQNYTYRCYIRNDGNTNITLSMNTSNWQPINASAYLTLSWNREAFILEANMTTDADLMLAVSPTTNGITNFSFDINIQASET